MQDIKIKQWYKMTEIGVIPEDWIEFKLIDIWTFKKWKNIPKDQITEEWLSCVVYWEIYTKYNNISYKLISKISEETSKLSTEIKYWDILFAWSGETVEDIWKSFSYLWYNKAYAWGDIIILSPKEANPILLWYLLNSDLVVSQKSKLWQWSSVIHIYASSLKLINIALPKDINEQKLIAKVLSDTDELITSLDELINKKEKIKEWTMQELLTWKRRLPWFNLDWEEKKLWDLIIKHQKTNRLSSEWMDSWKYPFFNNSTKDVNKYSDTYDYDWEMIIANTGWIAYFDYYNWKFWAMSDCFIFSSKVNTMFLFYILKRIQTYINDIWFSWSWIKHLDKKLFEWLEIDIPKDKKEQKNIVYIISHIDNEVRILKEKRNKYKQIKEWMMQELLTGKIRLD